MDNLQTYLMEAPMPATNYERFVMGLVLATTAHNTQEFNLAEKLIYQLSELIERDEVEKAIKFVAELDGQVETNVSEQVKLPLITANI